MEILKKLFIDYAMEKPQLLELLKPQKDIDLEALRQRLGMEEKMKINVFQIVMLLYFL